MNSIVISLIIICSFVIISLGVVKYYRLELVQTNGNSMYPTLLHGRPVLIRKRLKFPKDVVDGRIYVYTCPKGYLVIKRLSHHVVIGGKYYFFFEGDNKEYSEGSGHYGHVLSDCLEGILVFNKPNKGEVDNGKDSRN